MRNDSPHILEVVSDTICPWCYIAKRSIDAALASIDGRRSIRVIWRPFELNPTMPSAGMDRKAYRSAKFGSWEYSLALDARVTAVGAEAGIAFHHDRMATTPNTLASHVLIDLAHRFGVQDAVVEALFQAYFVDGSNVGDAAVLSDIGVACGLDRDAIGAALSDEPSRARVRAEARAFSQSGLSGVPTILFNRSVLATGALSAKSLALSITQAMAAENSLAGSQQVTNHA